VFNIAAIPAVVKCEENQKELLSGLFSVYCFTFTAINKKGEKKK
jgi:hypothetical protein